MPWYFSASYWQIWTAPDCLPLKTLTTVSKVMYVDVSRGASSAIFTRASVTMGRWTVPGHGRLRQCLQAVERRRLTQDLIVAFLCDGSIHSMSISFTALYLGNCNIR